MENHQYHHPSPQPKAGHPHHATHTMPDGRVMPGAKHGDHAGHNGHDHAGMISDFLQRFWISLALTLPVVIISPMFQHAVGYHFDFPGRDWVSFVNGVQVLKDGEHTGARPGKFVKGPGYKMKASK